MQHLWKSSSQILWKPRLVLRPRMLRASKHPDVKLARKHLTARENDRKDQATLDPRVAPRKSIAERTTARTMRSKAEARNKNTNNKLDKHLSFQRSTQQRHVEFECQHLSGSSFPAVLCEGRWLQYFGRFRKRHHDTLRKDHWLALARHGRVHDRTVTILEDEVRQGLL